MMSGIVAKARVLLYVFAEAWPPTPPLDHLIYRCRSLGGGHLLVAVGGPSNPNHQTVRRYGMLQDSRSLSRWPLGVSVSKLIRQERYLSLRQIISKPRL
jgi:hypothetical protein